MIFLSLEEPTSNRTAKKGKRRILVVEEEKPICDLLSHMFPKMGYEVTCVRNGEEGLRCFRREEYDLVLSDLTMYPMDGWTVARHIKDISPHTPVILMTGWGKEDILYRLGESNADFAMFKPIGFQDMKNTIESFL